MKFRILFLFLCLVLVVGCPRSSRRSGTSPNPGPVGEVDLFPVPVSDSTTLFPSVDDDYLEVAFSQGFTFAFYGTVYNSIFLNTNGGFTFGGGDDQYDVAAYEIPEPGVAIFWGDMDAAEYDSSSERPKQMTYQQFADRFVISYLQFQDNDSESWNNTARVTLYPDGTIVVEYGDVLSEDILVGVFDGTHTGNVKVPVQNEYPNYAAVSGTLLFDYVDDGTSHLGELNGRTITFRPGAVNLRSVSRVQAKLVGRGIAVEWRNPSQELMGFHLWRRTKGQSDWQRVSPLLAKAENGEYSWHDAHVSAQEEGYLYRLQQVRGFNQAEWDRTFFVRCRSAVPKPDKP